MDNIGLLKLTIGATQELTFFQIFTPIAICIAYFSMPEYVMPFIPSRSIFYIAMIIIVICVRLLFEISRGSLCDTWWWRIITWPLRFIRPDHTHHPIGERGGCLPAVFMRQLPYATDPEGIGPEDENMV